LVFKALQGLPSLHPQPQFSSGVGPRPLQQEPHLPLGAPGVGEVLSAQPEVALLEVEARGQASGLLLAFQQVAFSNGRRGWDQGPGWTSSLWETGERRWRTGRSVQPGLPHPAKRQGLQHGPCDLSLTPGTCRRPEEVSSPGMSQIQPSSGSQVTDPPSPALQGPHSGDWGSTFP
jgi:hypothetical protein